LLAAFGLGNPGDRYRSTRHNLGKETIFSLVEQLRLPLECGKGQFHYAHDALRDLYLAIPTTYVNTSGVSARQVLETTGVGLDSLLVVCDDFNLPLGMIRIRKKGSDGGHNGLASVIYHLESQEFPRLRLGVGPLPDDDIVGFVLSHFNAGDEDTVAEMRHTACEALLTIAEDGIDVAMNRFNRKVYQ
jgi:PTH1 family peptidyl-tRNA hydrolase